MTPEMQGWEPKDILTVLIAAVALIVSAISLAFSRSNKRAEDDRTVRSQINDVITRIIDVQSDNQREYFSAIQEDRLERWQLQSAHVSQKLMSLARIAVYLEGQTKIPSSDIECAMIASAMAAASDPLAAAYWEKAIEASPNDLYKVFSQRSYADYLFNQGKPKEGRGMYQSALGILKDDTDLTKYTDGFTLRMWGVSERNWGTESEAMIQFRKAEEKFNQLQREHVKAGALRDLVFAKNQTSASLSADRQEDSQNISYLREPE